MSVGSPLTVCAAFERAARWFAGNEAVVDSSTRLTYGQLDDMSRRAAAMFQATGARPGRPVAILAAPTAIYLVAWLGAIRMGAIPMALHVRESDETLVRTCRRMQPTLLVYDASMEAAAEAVATGCPSVAATIRARSGLAGNPTPTARPAAVLPDDLERFPADPLLPRPNEDDPAIIALSSGTTAYPKGVVHTHRSLVELARTDVYLYGGLRPSDRSLVPLSTAFIGCYNGWLPFLNAGACAVFMERFDLGDLLRKVASERISHVFLTPTLWRRLLNSDLSGIDFSSVRQIGFAAEVMDATTLERLRQTISPNVVQMYGSTETGAAATCNWAEQMTGERLVSVGRPMLNGDLRVVVPGGGPADEVPRGEVGEVLITSPSLAAHIWDDPELTEKSFIEDGERRWWRSRDLGRLDSEGFLYIAGRADDMIISAGINIMPARIEDVLLRHPGVAECAVVGVPDPEWGEKVEAFVVASDPALDASALDRHVRASELSPYQQPRAYSFVDDLPRTSTNKVNRRILRERATQPGVATTAGAAPALPKP